MKKLTLFGALLLSCSVLFGQATLTGVLKKEGSNEPIVGAIVTLRQQEISVQTDENGMFEFQSVALGNDVLEFEQAEIGKKNKPVTLKDGENNLGEVFLKDDAASMLENEVLLSAIETDFEIDDEDGMSAQSISGLLYSKGDVFSRTASYSFSPARYRLRGYAQSDEYTYINGVKFNDQERGRFNYSSIGGLNDATRNKEIIINFAPNRYTFGGIGNTTNIDMRASRFAAGTKVGLAGTNRSYWLRATATYATGIMDNGWALAVSGAYRWSYEGIQEGTFYNSGGYYLGAEKIFNPHHSLSIVTYGSPTERAGSSAITQETADLTSIYYNPYWGFQDGKKRNSRIVHSFDPTLIVSHEWKISETQNLNTGIAGHYSMYSNSALTFYNALDPRPDYYRNLPSYQLGGWHYDASAGGFYPSQSETNVELYNSMTNMWKTGYKAGGNSTTQIDWDALYQANYANNLNNPNELKMAKYMVERRHNNLAEAALNSVYDQMFMGEKLKMVVGLEAKYTQGKHYKTVDDLLGATQWVDIDPFADRDIADLSENVGLTQAQINAVRQNDVDNPNKIVKEGDVFGYNYDINIAKASVFAHNEWNFNKLKFFYGLKASYTAFNRYGYMRNGRAEYLNIVVKQQNPNAADVISKGAGALHQFVDPAAKAGISYDFNGHHHIEANVLGETRAPLANSFYVQQRVSDRSADAYDYNRGNSLLNFFSMQEKVLSYDFSYIMRYPIFTMRITGYRTHSLDGIEQNGYYNDEYRTFINCMMIDVDKIYQGLEFGASVKLNGNFTLSGAVAYNEAHYTDNAIGIESAENGMKLNGTDLEMKDRILIKDLKVASGPQLAANLKLNFFHQKMWFAEASISYFDESYLAIAPSRFSQGIMTGTKADGSTPKLVYTDEQKSVLGRQESLVSPNWYERIMVDLSVGKLIYLKDRKSININLSVNNVTNNTGMKTGGYQTGRIPTTTYQLTSQVSNNVNKYPAKYYYAWGVNFFLNIGFKF